MVAVSVNAQFATLLYRHLVSVSATSPRQGGDHQETYNFHISSAVAPNGLLERRTSDLSLRGRRKFRDRSILSGLLVFRHFRPCRTGIEVGRRRCAKIRDRVLKYNRWLMDVDIGLFDNLLSISEG